jgi:hypothetical protein
MANKKVIYVTIFGNYDNLKNPIFKNDGYDYVLFTDEETYKAQSLSKNNFWKINVIPNIVGKESAYHTSKDIKINPEKYLLEYESSIYIDGSFSQIGDVNVFLNESDNTYQMCRHPRRICAYEEFLICVKQKLGDINKTSVQFDRYEKEGFPKDFGLCMGGIIARTHNEKSKRINSLWWEEILKGSMRDQLSIPYVLWKLGEEIGFSDFEPNGIDQIFKLHSHSNVK